MNTLIKKWLVITALSLPLQPAQNIASAQCGNHIDEAIYENLPFDMPKVEQPVFPDYSVNILQFGAKSDGITLNTKAINIIVAPIKIFNII